MTPEEELVIAHWDYIEGVLRNAGETPEVITKIRYHYVTAMIHGIKHGKAMIQ